MKKVFYFFIGMLFAFSSCQKDISDNPSGNSDPSSSEKRSIVLDETAWFYGNAEYDFPIEDGVMYINYKPDILNTEKWIRIVPSKDIVYSAEIIWSKDIREIGTKGKVSIYSYDSKLLNIESDDFSFLNIRNLSSFSGVTASHFDITKVPALPSTYFSNFSGKYELSNGYEFSVGAKIGMSADVSHYWNANVLSVEYENETYDMLLAHSSARDASGSIDPGITGQEPFVNKQGLFWSHLRLESAPGSQWTVKWASEWKDTPKDALDSTLDKSASFTGPATTKIIYRYRFYFGNPKLKDSGYGYEAVNSVYIGEYTDESYVPKNNTWNDIKKIIPAYTVPEDKLENYWWYNTGSLSPLESSCVYDVTKNSTNALSLDSYDFYLCLKDKPVDTGIALPDEGTYKRYGDYTDSFTISGATITYNGTVYEVVETKIWQSGSTYNGYAVLVKDSSGKTYAMYLNNYFSASPACCKVRPPKEFDGVLPDAINWGIMNSQFKQNFNKQ